MMRKEYVCLVTSIVRLVRINNKLLAQSVLKIIIYLKISVFKNVRTGIKISN